MTNPTGLYYAGKAKFIKENTFTKRDGTAGKNYSLQVVFE